MDGIIPIEPSLNIVDVINENCPEYFLSLEFTSMYLEDKNVVGLICSSFTRYWGRMLDSGDAPQFAKCVNTVEILASSDDDMVENYVVTEILENLPEKMDSPDFVMKKFGSNTKKVYDRWLG